MRRVFNVIESNATSSPANHSATISAAPQECIEAIQSAWAQALRSDFGRTRDAILCELAQSTQELAQQYPNDARTLLWNGIVLTGYAKSLGGLCALQFQSTAKASLERAIALAPKDGAAYLYLGLLYDQAPEAPYSFGNETMAKALLEQGLALTLNAQGQRLGHIRLA
ncbi:TRAP transporter TatT component family protein [Limnobacter parvus]|uniref:TRAP transporter TatT component family protein n=1 Tax=Limnobacter parvus TaxID=2939690 RepID=A0ABT1XDC1_9BURK|nr:TRAP transporter TatT component family protein [Limnobacter parvus]MCR2745270.1 TRAP transporter TatT component family protein [Limnobacter parvus]